MKFADFVNFMEVKMADGRDDKMKMYLDIYYEINFTRKVYHNKRSKKRCLIT